MSEPTARAVMENEVSEKDFQQAVVDLARVHGWLVHRVWDSRRSPEGWPDLFLLKDGVALAWECKRQDERARPSAAQETWLRELRKMPGMRWQSAMVIRPSSWPVIEAILSGQYERERRAAQQRAAERSTR